MRGMLSRGYETVKNGYDDRLGLVQGTAQAAREARWGARTGLQRFKRLLEGFTAVNQHEADRARGMLREFVARRSCSKLLGMGTNVT